MPKTTRAIRELLERHNVKPSGDAKKDMEAAKLIMKPLKDKLTKRFNR